MDGVRLDEQADVLVHVHEVGGLDHPLEAVDIDDDLIVDAEEGDTRHDAAQVALSLGHDIHVLGPHDHVDRFLRGKALVHALEHVAGEADLVILEHHAVEDVALADEVGDEGVDRLVVDVGRGADLLEAKDILPENQKLEKALKDVESSRPKSLMTVCPPYNNVNCIFYSGTDTINMAGQTYINSIFIGENIYNDSRLDFNLNGEYSSITFDVGHVDGSGTRSREMQILYNEQLVKKICLSGTGLTQSITLDVSGVDQLTLIIPTGLGLIGERACYGIVNAYIYPETASIA